MPAAQHRLQAQTEARLHCSANVSQLHDSSFYRSRHSSPSSCCRYDFIVLNSPLLPPGVRLSQVAEGIPEEDLHDWYPSPGGGFGAQKQAAESADVWAVCTISKAACPLYSLRQDRLCRGQAAGGRMVVIEQALCKGGSRRASSPTSGFFSLAFSPRCRGRPCDGGGHGGRHPGAARWAARLG